MSLESSTDLTYPGGKKPQRAAPRPAQAPSATWDARPVIKIVRGAEVHLYPIGALARALGRAAVTMRLWERDGVLPRATFRLANKNGIGGRRYFTRDQIEAVIAAATKHGLMGTRASIPPEFTTDVLAAWAELKKKKGDA